MRSLQSMKSSSPHQLNNIKQKNSEECIEINSSSSSNSYNEVINKQPRAYKLKSNNEEDDEDTNDHFESAIEDNDSDNNSFVLLENPVKNLERTIKGNKKICEEMTSDNSSLSNDSILKLKNFSIKLTDSKKSYKEESSDSLSSCELDNLSSSLSSKNRLSKYKVKKCNVNSKSTLGSSTENESDENSDIEIPKQTDYFSNEYQTKIKNVSTSPININNSSSLRKTKKNKTNLSNSLMKNSVEEISECPLTPVSLNRKKDSTPIKISKVNEKINNLNGDLIIKYRKKLSQGKSNQNENSEDDCVIVDENSCNNRNQDEDRKDNSNYLENACVKAQIYSFPSSNSLRNKNKTSYKQNDNSISMLNFEENHENNENFDLEILPYKITRTDAIKTFGVTEKKLSTINFSNYQTVSTNNESSKLKLNAIKNISNKKKSKIRNYLRESDESSEEDNTLSNIIVPECSRSKHDESFSKTKNKISQHLKRKKIEDNKDNHLNYNEIEVFKQEENIKKSALFGSNTDMILINFSKRSKFDPKLFLQDSKPIVLTPKISPLEISKFSNGRAIHTSDSTSSSSTFNFKTFVEKDSKHDFRELMETSNNKCTSKIDYMLSSDESSPSNHGDELSENTFSSLSIPRKPTYCKKSTSNLKNIKKKNQKKYYGELQFNNEETIMDSQSINENEHYLNFNNDNNCDGLSNLNSKDISLINHKMKTNKNMKENCILKDPADLALNVNNKIINSNRYGSHNDKECDKKIESNKIMENSKIQINTRHLSNSNLVTLSKQKNDINIQNNNSNTNNTDNADNSKCCLSDIYPTLNDKNLDSSSKPSVLIPNKLNSNNNEAIQINSKQEISNKVRNSIKCTSINNSENKKTSSLETNIIAKTKEIKKLKNLSNCKQNIIINKETKDIMKSKPVLNTKIVNKITPESKFATNDLLSNDKNLINKEIEKNKNVKIIESLNKNSIKPNLAISKNSINELSSSASNERFILPIKSSEILSDSVSNSLADEQKKFKIPKCKITDEKNKNIQSNYENETVKSTCLSRNAMRPKISTKPISFTGLLPLLSKDSSTIKSSLNPKKRKLTIDETKNNQKSKKSFKQVNSLTSKSPLSLCVMIDKALTSSEILQTLSELEKKRYDFSHEVGTSYPYLSTLFLIPEYIKKMSQVTSLNLNLLIEFMSNKESINLESHEQTELCKLISRSAGLVNYFRMFNFGHDLRVFDKKNKSKAITTDISEDLTNKLEDPTDKILLLIPQLTISEGYVIYSSFLERLNVPFKKVEPKWSDKIKNFGIKITFQNDYVCGKFLNSDSSHESCVTFVMHEKKRKILDDNLIFKVLHENSFTKSSSIESQLGDNNNESSILNPLLEVKKKIADEDFWDEYYVSAKIKKIEKIPQKSYLELRQVYNMSIKNAFEKRQNQNFQVGPKYSSEVERFKTHAKLPTPQRGNMMKAKKLTKNEYEKKVDILENNIGIDTRGLFDKISNN